MNSTIAHIPSVGVPVNYIIDPAEETILLGDRLTSGMVVVLATHPERENPDTEPRNDWHRSHILETAYWAEVLDIRFSAGSHGNTLVSMTCRYADGRMASRSYTTSFGWVVKNSSIPKHLSF